MVLVNHLLLYCRPGRCTSENRNQSCEKEWRKDGQEFERTCVTMWKTSWFFLIHKVSGTSRSQLRSFFHMKIQRIVTQRFCLCQAEKVIGPWPVSWQSALHAKIQNLYPVPKTLCSQSCWIPVAICLLAVHYSRCTIESVKTVDCFQHDVQYIIFENQVVT